MYLFVEKGDLNEIISLREMEDLQFAITPVDLDTI